MSCESSVAPIDKTRIKLSPIDVSVTESFIKVHVSSPSNAESFVLKRNGKIVHSFRLTVQDTIISDTGIPENSSCQYSLQAYKDNKLSSESNSISMHTLLPTSHDFEFHTYHFNAYGEGFRDITIINENDIWAVGNLEFDDSLNSKGEPKYVGAAHWDGRGWKFYEVYERISSQNSTKLETSLKSVCETPNNKFFFASHCAIYKYLDNEWIEKAYLDASSILKMWARDENDIYCAGEAGGLFHYYGSGWKKLESGTKVSIRDVWGIDDAVTGEKKVYCAVSYYTDPGDLKILTIDKNDKVDSLRWGMPDRRISTVWTNKGFPIYVGGGGVFDNRCGSWHEVKEIPLIYSCRIRGNGLNDILVVGDYNLVAHYNGVNWKYYPEFYAYASYESCDIKGDVIAMVGGTGASTFITIGKRK
jgi:hypothetical protein